MISCCFFDSILIVPIKPNLKFSMKWIDLTYKSPAENLACDEVLLDVCEEGREGEILRFWEPTAPFVVLGYSNRWRTEVDASACARNGVPILRRCSGGGTVLQGPGCLNYSLILKIEGERTLGSITETNRTVMERNARALAPLLSATPLVQGHTDLTLENLKFSGNSQRRRRKCALVHGTFLLNFDLAAVETCLPMPSEQPAYRGNRPHRHFLTNLKVAARDVKAALRREWQAEEPLESVPDDRVRALARDTYDTDDWNRKF
jgi:lipoate-protein ligase A